MNFKSYIKDTYTNLKTRTLLHDYNGMSNLEKQKVFKCIYYLAKQPKLLYELQDKYPFAQELRIKFIRLIKNFDQQTCDNMSDSDKLDKIKLHIEDCNSDECLMAHALITFHAIPKSLLMITTSIHTRVKPMIEDGKDGWFDNFSLNSYLYQLTTFVYSEFDTNDDPSIFSIHKPKMLIKKQKTISNPKSLLYNLGNLYRCFMEFGIGSENEIEQLSNEEALEYLDKLVYKYPYFTFQCHGCDCFHIPSKTCNIGDIYEFTKRYPNTLIGGILNTETYASGKGQHWMCMMFLNSQVYLICSQASKFSDFHDGGRLEKELNAYGFGKQYNKIQIQHDPSNCGLYSVLFNIMSIIQLDKLNQNQTEDPFLNLNEIVNEVGRNAKKINQQGIYKLKELLIGWQL